MTKRELLIQICEQPGFEADESSMHARFTEELHREGWIQPRGNGGWEATSKALDEYPQFGGQEDIRDLSSVRVIADASGRKEEMNPSVADVSRERAVIFVRSLLTELPMDRVAAHAAQVRGSLPPSSTAWAVAENIVDKLLAVGR